MTIRSPHYFADHFPGIEKQFTMPLNMFIAGDIDARDGLGADGVMIGKFLAANYVESALEYDDSATAAEQYTDVTADLNASGSEEFYGTSEEVDDAIYFGDSNQFSGLLVSIATAGVGGGITWEYYTDQGAWVNLATAHELIDTTVGFTAGTSVYTVSWKQPSNAGVAASIGDAQASSTNKYWVRARVTTASITTAPIVTSVVTYSGIDGSGYRVPFNGYLERVSFTAQTEADDDDLELNIINATRGTYATVTLPDDSRIGSAAVDYPANGLFFQRGDEVIIQAVSTASAEMADVNLTLEFRV